MFEGAVKVSPDRERLLGVLFRSVKWSDFVRIIREFKTLRQEFERGGFNWNKVLWDHGIRSVKMALRRRADLAESIEVRFFMVWYQNYCRKEIKEKLDDYFQSEEYDNWIGSRDIASDEYALPDEKFTEFSSRWGLKERIFLLLFSPINFTGEQAEVLMGVETPLEMEIADSKSVRSEQSSSVVKFKKDISQLKQQIGEQTESLKTANKEIKVKKKEIDQLSGIISLKDQTIQNITTEFREKEAGWEKKYKDGEAKWDSEKHAISGELSVLEEEVTRLKEDQARLNVMKSDIERKLANKTNKNKKLNYEVHRLTAELENSKEPSLWQWLFEDKNRMKDILQQLDLKPQTRDLIINKIRIPDRDVRLVQPSGGNLQNFWNRFIEREKRLSGKIQDLIEASRPIDMLQNKWPEIKDYFIDLQYSLEARLALVKLLHEILQQTQIEEKHIPPTTKS